MSESPAPIPIIPEPSRSTEIARLELAQFAPDAPLDHVFRRACELCAQTLSVERVGVWVFVDNRASLRCANLFERTKGQHSAGAILRVADFPTYFAALNIRKAVPAEVAATEPWTAELAAAYLRPLGITSMLDAGIFVDSQMVGVVCCEHVGPVREWTTEDRDFTGSVADLLAIKIQSANKRELSAAFLTQGQRLVALEKGMALEQFAAGVAHDFRNLLSVMQTYGEMFRDRTDLPEDIRKGANAIVLASERAAALAKELLDFAHPEEQPPAVLDLAEVTAQLLPMLQAAVGGRHTVGYIRTMALGLVLISKTQYMRALLNLVVNARDAMPDGGTIEIRLSPVSMAGNPSYKCRFVMLEVIDRGVGMDEPTRKRIFQPYFSTKSKGVGLGLAVVWQVMDRVGGQIRVESSPGAGTTFRLFFPHIGPSSGETKEYLVSPERIR